MKFLELDYRYTAVKLTRQNFRQIGDTDQFLETPDNTIFIDFES